MPPGRGSKYMPVPVRRPANKKPPDTPGQCKIRPPAQPFAANLPAQALIAGPTAICPVPHAAFVYRRGIRSLPPVYNFYQYCFKKPRIRSWWRGNT